MMFDCIRGDTMPLPKNGKRTDAQRRARNKYEKDKFTIVAAKLKIETADSFKRAAAANGTTVNAILTACALDYIAAHAAPDQDAPKEE